MNEIRFQAFDTNCRIALAEPDAALLKELYQLCMQFESKFSAHLPSSDIGRINSTDLRSYRIHETTAELIEKTLPYCERYPDLFDIALGNATMLWNFHEGHECRPDQTELAEASRHEHASKIRVVQDDKGHEIILPSPTSKLDLGACAKGYIADALAEKLVDHNTNSALIDLGGHIHAHGTHPSGRPWKIGIEDPRDTNRRIASVQACSESVVTSSGSHRGFVQDGQSYQHILDPATGLPIRTDLLSATIIDADSLKADCLSTILFAAGFERAVDIARVENVRCLLVDNKGRTFTAPARNPCPRASTAR